MVSLIASDEVKGFKRVLDTRRRMFIDILQGVKSARLDVIPPCVMSAWRILKSISKWILESDIESESETGTEFRGVCGGIEMEINGKEVKKENEWAYFGPHRLPACWLEDLADESRALALFKSAQHHYRRGYFTRGHRQEMEAISFLWPKFSHD